MQTALPSTRNSFFYVDKLFFSMIILHSVCYLLFLIITLSWPVVIMAPLKMFSILFALWLWNETRRIITIRNNQSPTNSGNFDRLSSVLSIWTSKWFGEMFVLPLQSPYRYLTPYLSGRSRTYRGTGQCICNNIIKHNT